jgi:uncharacterized CHY-type Zn-finger protein
MGEYNPTYMVDCRECASQMWGLLDWDSEKIRIECGKCQSKHLLSLSRQMSGEKCALCQTYFNIVEHIEDEHVMLECQNTECGEIAEIWLRDDV